MTNHEKYKRSLSYWSMSFYYLNITEVIFEKTIESGNKWVVIDDFPIDDKTYHEITKFSDFNLMVPALFNLYHGLELLLKGFVLIKKEIEVELNHKIESLFEDFIYLYPEQKEIINAFEKYIIVGKCLEPLKSFFRTNDISPNKYYESLRYPVNKNFTVEYDHYELKYNEEEAIPFFMVSLAIIKRLKPIIIKLGRSFEV